MLSERDLKQIADKGISEKQIENQLNEFKTGFPFLRLEAAASVEHGIVATTEESRAKFEKSWEQYKAAGKKVVKFEIGRASCRERV